MRRHDRETQGEIYLVAPSRTYVLLRLDELLANQPGVSYEHRIVTVEHVLPQHPKKGSQWLTDFDESAREYWTHRLANLVLLNRRKNSSAQRFDFAKKKHQYFQAAMASRLLRSLCRCRKGVVDASDPEGATERACKATERRMGVDLIWR